MTGVEIVLILIGIIFMIGSFMVTEKLSSSELDSIAKMSETEIKVILDKEMDRSTVHIQEQIEGAIDASIDKVERALDKETNEKIMAISEYSDTVLESMNKTHNEIMFLYSMLNDKHAELTDLSAELSKVATKVEGNIETASAQTDDVREEIKEKEQETVISKEEPKVSEEENGNHNEKILELYNQGKTYIDIAKELGLVQGEVKLVVELFKGE
jgi:DNA-binding NarL/FixJ family response regulator